MKKKPEPPAECDRLHIDPNYARAFIPLDPAQISKGQEYFGSAKLPIAHLKGQGLEGFGAYLPVPRSNSQFWDFGTCTGKGDMVTKGPSSFDWFCFVDVCAAPLNAPLILNQLAAILKSRYLGMTAAPDLSDLAYQLNDYIHESRYKGGFVSALLGHWDEGKGEALLCGAGINHYHLWKAKKARFLECQLSDSPSLGPFSSFLIKQNRSANYSQVKIALEPGDILLFCLSTYREATRVFRDSAGKAIETSRPDPTPRESLAAFLNNELAKDYEETAASGRLSPRAARCLAQDLIKALNRLLSRLAADRNLPSLLNKALEGYRESLGLALPRDSASAGDALARLRLELGAHLEKARLSMLEGLAKDLKGEFPLRPDPAFLGGDLPALVHASIRALESTLPTIVCRSYPDDPPWLKPRRFFEVLGATPEWKQEVLPAQLGKGLAEGMASILETAPDSFFYPTAENGFFICREKASSLGSWLRRFLGSQGRPFAERLYRDDPGLEKLAGSFLNFRDPLEESMDIPKDFGFYLDPLLAAYAARGRYRLERPRYSAGDEVLDFDFTTCTGGVEETAMVILAAERAFGLYRDATTGPGDSVLVEASIDAFLQAHLAQVGRYRREGLVAPHDNPQEPGYVVWRGVKEEDRWGARQILALGRPAKSPED